MTINPDAEIIHVYRSLFDALSSRKNPYSCPCIFHRAEFNKVVMGDFNYPPLEIWPYWLVYKATGMWNIGVFTATLIALQAAVCLVLWRTFPETSPLFFVPFFLIFAFFEVHTNVATSFLFVALILWAIKNDMAKPAGIYRYLLWIFFGMGLLTKFIVIPVFGAFIWHRVDLRRRETLIRAAVDLAAVLAIAAVFMAPFGVANVLKSTLLFNLNLDVRDQFTTFYPNGLSGVMTWMHARGVYPVVAVLALGAAILVAPKIGIFSAILAAATTFMFVSPTPEPQYIPVVLYIAVAAHLLRSENAHLGADARIPDPGAYGRPVP